MKPHRLFLALLMAALVAGCDHGRSGAAPSPQLAPATRALSGQPCWLPIGPDIYYEGGVEEVEKQVLSVQQESRWFRGFDREVSKAEFDAYVAQIAAQSTVQDVDGRYSIPTMPPYPKSLEDLPLHDQGVRLSLAVTSGADAVGMTLTLSSAERDVYREVEHRWTNALPFLFAFYVDGRAVVITQGQFGKIGGMNHADMLVKSGGSRVWTLRVDGRSLRSLLPDDAPHELCIATALSDRQHEGYVGGQVAQRLASPWPLPQAQAGRRQVLVRSGVACLKWDGSKWTEIGSAE
jgi:hypothetical protein